MKFETGHLTWSGADGMFSATKGHRLIVGGLPSDLQQSTAADSVITTKQGLNGCVKDIAFIDDRSIRSVAMDEPLAFERAKIGRSSNYKHQKNVHLRSQENT